MGERAQAAWEKDREDAFRDLPWRDRLRAQLPSWQFFAGVAVTGVMFVAISLLPDCSSQATTIRVEPVQTLAQSWSCSPRKTCGKIDSCDEARWYLANCPWGGKLDRDSDGSPCETLCGGGN